MLKQESSCFKKIRTLASLKTYLRDFEKYIETYYDFQILRTKKTRLETWIVDCGMKKLNFSILNSWFWSLIIPEFQSSLQYSSTPLLQLGS
jgi:hypothetical protein